MNNFEWAAFLANKYGISLGTVFGVFKSWKNRRYANGRFLTRRERTEEFFKLYFEGRNEQ